MREKFELHCKTVGLVIFCLGLYSSLTSIPMFFQKAPDATKMLPSILRTLSPGDIAELQHASAYVWKYATKNLLLSGIAPILMGIYLMRSNNLFVRLCYPTADRRSSSLDRISKPIELDVASKTPGNANAENPENRYAPPGYFDR